MDCGAAVRVVLLQVLDAMHDGMAKCPLCSTAWHGLTRDDRQKEAYQQQLNPLAQTTARQDYTNTRW